MRHRSWASACMTCVGVRAAFAAPVFVTSFCGKNRWRLQTNASLCCAMVRYRESFPLLRLSTCSSGRIIPDPHPDEDAEQTPSNTNMAVRDSCVVDN